MYLCGIIGIVDIVFGILSLYLHFWIAASIFFLIAVRRAIVFKMEKKKAENGKGSQEDDRKSRLKKRKSKEGKEQKRTKE